MPGAVAPKLSDAIGNRDLPALFNVADCAAQRCNRMHIGLTAANLVFLATGALIEVIPAYIVSPETCNFTAAACFLLGLLATMLSSNLKLERKWYTARSVAESARTIAWQYMMRAGSRKQRESEPSPESQVIAELAAALRRLRETGALLNSAQAEQHHVTPRMKSIRESELAERQRIYIEHRLDAQRAWYAEASEGNRRMSSMITALVVVAQLFALAASGASMSGAHMKWGSALAGAASGLIGWSKFRRYAELAESYGVAAQDLGLIAERARQQFNEEQLTEFVRNSEAAISREHALWRAGRAVPSGFRFE